MPTSCPFPFNLTSLKQDERAGKPRAPKSLPKQASYYYYYKRIYGHLLIYKELVKSVDTNIN